MKHAARSKQAFVRELLREMGGRAPHQMLVEAVLASYGRKEVITAAESQASRDVGHAMAIKNVDGFSFAKRHGDTWVLLADDGRGETRTSHTEPDLRRVVSTYRNRAIASRRQGWKHVGFGRRHLLTDIADEMLAGDGGREVTVSADEVAS